MVLKYLLEKEFKQLLRNKFLPRLVILMPIVALSLLPMVANFTVKDTNVSIVDHDNSITSQRLIQKITSSGYFHITDISSDHVKALQSVEQDDADLILEIPRNFEKNTICNENTSLSISANAVNGMRAGLSTQYLLSILSDYNMEMLDKHGNIIPSGIESIPHYLYNPQLEYKYAMVPAIMMMILTMLCGFLPALNIVSEKANGTIEQMNVTPVSKFTLILSKLIPYWAIGFLVLSISFLIAWIGYGLISAGGYFTIYCFAAVFILALSGFGLIISNYANSVQQAMFMMFFFVSFFIFLSGLYTPVSSMPEWTQQISRISPLRYMVEALRSVFLKGSSIIDLKDSFLTLIGFAFFSNLWAVLSYRKNS